jgi:hypothetical protein
VKLLATPRPGRTGFTIVEVVAAMGILLMGMTVIIGLMTFGAALSRTAALRSAAAAAAEAVVLDLEESFFPLEKDGSAGEPTDIIERPLMALDGLIYSARASVNPDNPLEYRVDIELSWESAGVRRTSEFSTLLLRQIPFGERLRREFTEREPNRSP